MEQDFVVKKALNNNVIIAEHPAYQEVVLIGKGIGFNQKRGDIVPFDKADKTFLLQNETDKEQYVNLLSTVDKTVLEFANEVIIDIEKRMGQPLNEHIHVALSDHLAFAISRAHQGMHFSNPFLVETESLYPKEFQVAQEVVDKVERRFDISFSEGEVGFVALHIHSAVTDRSISDLNKHHTLITKLIEVIEETLKIKIEKGQVNYSRLVQHLHRAIDRTEQGERLEHQEKLAEMLKITYPVCYNLAWKLIKVMQRQLNKTVNETEALYLTIHLQRLTNTTI